jgi:hypothetical protein
MHNKNQPKNATVSAGDDVCLVCGEKLIHEKCKVLCRSKKCIYRIVNNCSEF